MEQKVLNNLSYGIFVLTASKDGKDNGCIINTAVQVASDPVTISIAVNKANYTCGMICDTKKFTISMLSEAADFETVKHFGCQSGKDIDKFKDYKDCKRVSNGTMAVTAGTNSYISVDVSNQVDLGSHILFIGTPTEGEILTEALSASYAYYFSNIKPKAEKIGETSGGQIIWKCRICGYVYVGDELPEGFICPVCKHPAADFEKIIRMPPKNKYEGTKTEKNLWEAFTGESKARNKYTYFASVAKKAGFEQISEIFTQTAANEKEHAELWFKELGQIGDTACNLANAADGEHEEWTEMYSRMSKEADEEGFHELAKKFRGIMAIEKVHENRFRKLLENVEMGQVFEKTGIAIWECRNCGHIIVSTQAPEECPICAHPKAYFQLRCENY